MSESILSKFMATQEHEYEAVFIPEEDGGFSVIVPDLPGCVSEGGTLQKAEANIQEAIELYLETHAELGWPISKPTTKKMIKVKVTVLKKSSGKKHAKTTNN